VFDPSSSLPNPLASLPGLRLIRDFIAELGGVSSTPGPLPRTIPRRHLKVLILFLIPSFLLELSAWRPPRPPVNLGVVFIGRGRFPTARARSVSPFCGFHSFAPFDFPPLFCRGKFPSPSKSFLSGVEIRLYRERLRSPLRLPRCSFFFWHPFPFSPFSSLSLFSSYPAPFFSIFLVLSLFLIPSLSPDGMTRR